MRPRDLEITFLGRRAIAAYLRLTAAARTKPLGTRSFDDGRILVDIAEDGLALGVEILEPGERAVDCVNAVLRELDEPQLTEDEAAPLVALDAA